MKKYLLTDQHIANIKVFMNRTKLSGEEVPAFRQVIEALNSPKKDLSDEEVLMNVPFELLEKVFNIRRNTKYTIEETDEEETYEEETDEEDINIDEIAELNNISNKQIKDETNTFNKVPNLQGNKVKIPRKQLKNN